MPNPCNVCTHPDRPVIDGLLGSGASQLEIAARYSIGRGSVGRHARNHLQQNLTSAFEHAQATLDSINTTAVMGRALDLANRADKLLNKAEQGLSSPLSGPQGITAAAAAMREARSTIELLAKLAIASADVQGSAGRVQDDDLDDQLRRYMASRMEPAAAITDGVEDAEVVE